MSTRSYTSLRRLSAHLLAASLLCLGLCKDVKAQSISPAATASYVTTLTPPAKLGLVYQTALDTFGDLLVVDYANGALYEYPVGGGAVVTLVAAGGLGSGYANPGIAIDSTNNLYIEANYNNCLLKFSYSTATQSWTGLSTVTPANATTAICPNSGGTSPYIFAQGDTPNTAPYYFQPWAITADSNNNLVITAQNNNNFVFNEPVIGSGAAAKAGTANNLLLVKAAGRASSVAADRYGNVYIVEESDKTPTPGVLMIPAGQTNIAADTGLARVDPNLPNVSGVATDAAGNLYISDSKLGVFFVPNPAGTPEPASATLVTAVAASAQVSLDQARGILYVPTYNASGSQVIDAVTFNRVELGSAPTASATAATPATPLSVLFGLNTSTTVGSVVIQEGSAANFEDGVTVNPDFAITSGGTCAAGAAIAAYGNCTVNVTLTPHAVGSVSARLLLLDNSSNVLGSILLHGTGIGSAVQVLPGTESARESGLSKPSQIAVDAAGTAYIADPGLGKIRIISKVSAPKPVTLNTALTAPTGVAIDGGGDLFVADQGRVLEEPVSATGFNVGAQATLMTGLGGNVQLAVDGLGNLFIADPDNHRIVRLGNTGGSVGLLSQTETDLGGFNAPSALAVDQNDNLYVADGSDLYQITPAGVQSTLLTSLAAVTGLAVDPSGAVYVTSGGQTTRIPNVGGTLIQGSQVAIAADDTGASSVALDPSGNVYLTNTVAGNEEVISPSGSIDFGTQTSLTASAAQPFTVLNFGNLPLNITGLAGTADFTGSTTNCTGGPIAVGATCGITVTFSPGPGDQGTLTGTVAVNGDEANTPVGVSVTGVGLALAASKTTVTVTGANVDAAPAVVVVAPASGTGATPTGQVTLTVTGTSLTKPVSATGTLAGGTVTIKPPQLATGTYTFTVSYGGDRAYAPSTATTQGTVGAGPVNLIQPTMAQVQQAFPGYPYVLAAGAGADEPYDGSVVQFEPNYQVKVVATDGVALVGLPILDPKTGKLVATNYGSVTFQGAPAGSNCAALPVAADGTVSFAATCLSINTTNSSIPNFESSYTLTPVYSPAGAGASLGTTNPNYTMQTGTPIAFTALRNPMVQISASPSTVTVTAGSSTTVTLSLSSLLGYGIAGSGSLLNNYSLPLQLACDGLPAYATCSFSYPTPDPTDAQSVNVGPAAGTVLSYRGAAAAACTAAQGCVGPGTVKMTITTNVPVTGATASLRNEGQTAFAAMFGVGMLGFLFGKRKSLQGRLLLLACLLACGSMMAGITGCSTTQLGTKTGTPSPAGTYAVIVTAKQVGSQVITQYPGIVYGNQNQMSLPFTMNLTVQ